MHKRHLASIALACVSASAVASDRAVEAIHYEVGLGAQYVDYEGTGIYSGDDAHATTAYIGSELTLPIGPALGLGGTVGYTRSRTESSNNTLRFNDEQLYGSVNLFYRNPSVGRISVGYGREREHSSYSGSQSYFYGNGYTTYSDSFLSMVEAYVGPVTLQATNARVYPDDTWGYVGHEDFLHVSAYWYVIPRVRLGVDVGLKDARDGYLVDAEFQPAFFDNAAGIYISYGRGELDEGHSNLVGVGINVYFNKRFDLVTRDRHYR